MKKFILFTLMLSIFSLAYACDDEKKEDANELGVGSSCSQDATCTGEDQECLTDFKGGYCGIVGCTEDASCPSGSRCVMHDDNENYCFLTCVDKVDCNVNRAEDDEANCSGSVDYVEDATDEKACIPPSN